MHASAGNRGLLCDRSDRIVRDRSSVYGLSSLNIGLITWLLPLPPESSTLAVHHCTDGANFCSDTLRWSLYLVEHGKTIIDHIS